MAKMAAVRKKEARWRRHLRGHASSGLSVSAYCRQHRLRACSFYWWRRELARRDAEPPAAFVPVTVAAQTPAHPREGRIEIVLPGARRVRVVGSVDRQMLADVLSVLEDQQGRREHEGGRRC
jgi:hypothetical protein